jgi:hypothetical protein
MQAGDMDRTSARSTGASAEELNDLWQNTSQWLVAVVVVIIGRFILVVAAFPEPQDGENIVPHLARNELISMIGPLPPMWP